MFITIIEVNDVAYKQSTSLKEVRRNFYIPDCFTDEAQFDRWFDEVFKKFPRYHLRQNNKPEIHEFENLKLKLRFS